MFVAVASLESFAAAGRELGVSGAAISKQIQNLEIELGVKLFTRTTRHVALTEEGELYFRGASRALADLRETQQRLHELKECPTGRLKVNAPMSFGNAFLTQPIADFAKCYPDVQLEVDFDDRWVDVIGEGYDVVVRVGSMQDSTLQARKLAECPLVLCASVECLQRFEEIEAPSDLTSIPAVTYSQHGQSEVWHYQGPKDTGSVKLNKAFSTNTAEMQIQACKKGIGVALLPMFTAAGPLSTGELVKVLPNYRTRPARSIHALFPPGRANSARVRLFLDSLVEASKTFDW